MICKIVLAYEALFIITVILVFMIASDLYKIFPYVRHFHCPLYCYWVEIGFCT